MRWLERLSLVALVALLLVPSWPEAARPLAPALDAWVPPLRPTPICGAAVAPVAVLADPADAPDAEAEAVWLRNFEPEPVALVGWTLTAGGRGVLHLGEVVLGPGEQRRIAGRALRPVRLRNAGGELALADPCGITTWLAWPEAEAGHVEAAAGELGPPYATPPPGPEEDPP